MPSKPKSICANPACHKKVDGTYCEAHQRKSYGYSSKQHPWYNLPLWKGNPNLKFGQRGGLRERQIMEEPYCRKCKEEKGIYKDCTGKRAGVADHITPFEQGNTKQDKWELFTDFDNLQTLCFSCHASKSASESNKG